MVPLKEDGSLDCERIDSLSIGRHIEVIGELTEEQYEEYLDYMSSLPREETHRPIEPIRVDERYEKHIIEKHTTDRNYRHGESAAKIAVEYLAKHPRPEYFCVRLCSSTEDSMDDFYKVLNADEQALIREWEETRKDDFSLDEFLREKNRNLYERVVSNTSLYALDRISGCDLDDRIKYSKCHVREYDPNCNEYRDYDSMFPLSDEEYLTLLTDRIASYRSLTMNSVVVYHTELAQKIMQYLICITGMVYENYNPFMVIFSEIDEAFEDIVEHEEELDLDLQNYLSFRKILGGC